VFPCTRPKLVEIIEGTNFALKKSNCLFFVKWIRLSALPPISTRGAKRREKKLVEILLKQRLLGGARLSGKVRRLELKFAGFDLLRL
jgi:hypothetical protein